MERGDWTAAMAEVGHDIPWYERRVNLLVDGLDLPQIPGATIRIGADVVLLVTRECDPCHRMETLAEGLKAALTPDWRGGVCTRVLAGGRIAVDDEIRIETIMTKPFKTLDDMGDVTGQAGAGPRGSERAHGGWGGSPTTPGCARRCRRSPNWRIAARSS